MVTFIIKIILMIASIFNFTKLFLRFDILSMAVLTGVRLFDFLRDHVTS